MSNRLGRDLVMFAMPAVHRTVGTQVAQAKDFIFTR